MKFKVLPATIAFLVCLPSIAQNTPASSSAGPPQFDAASVKMVDSSPHPVEDLVRGIGATSVNRYPTSRVAIHNARMMLLLNIAYGADQRYIENAPGWSDSQLYDLDAEVDGGRQLSLDEMKPLLQRLLEERFHLQVHRVSKPVSGFALIVAKGGPRLQPESKPDNRRNWQIYSNGLDAWSITSDKLAGVLSAAVGSPVVDRSGLTGSYDVHLKYAPANDLNSPLADRFTAIQEQLGLKLVPQKVPVEYLVIDHVDRTPTEN